MRTARVCRRLRALFPGAAQELAADFPSGNKAAADELDGEIAEVDAGRGEPFAWPNSDESSTEEQLGLAVDDFGVIFAYPWPDEERIQFRGLLIGILPLALDELL